MKRVSVLLTIVILLAGAASAQQPNTLPATMTINFTQGPPYPVTGVQLPTGVLAALQFSGGANAPIILAIAGHVAPVGLPTPLGFFDLDVGTFGILANGTQPGSTWHTDNTGALTLAGPIPTSTPTGVTSAYQAAMFNPAAPSLYTLTAATEFTITVGVVTQNIVLGDDTFQNIDLTSYGFTIPFYTGNYTNFFICSNGLITFEQGSTDFTPTPGEFNSQMPRICNFWTDLTPNNGGDVKMHIVPPGIAPPVNSGTFQIGSPTFFANYSPMPVHGVRVEWNNIQEFGSGGTHTFATEMYALLGDVYLFNSVFNPAAQFEVLMGIGPGHNLSSVSQKDLSTFGSSPGVVGAVNESFYEWFGDPTMPFYNGPLNLWDMVNQHLLCFPSGSAGTPNAAYTCTN